MVEFKVLSERRSYLLEQIGAAADEIRQIDELLSCGIAKDGVGKTLPFTVGMKANSEFRTFPLETFQ